MISILVVMKVLDIGLKIPDIIPPTIVMTVVFLMMKLLKCLRVLKYLDIDILIADTLP